MAVSSCSWTCRHQSEIRERHTEGEHERSLHTVLGWDSAQEGNFHGRHHHSQLKGSLEQLGLSPGLFQLQSADRSLCSILEYCGAFMQFGAASLTELNTMGQLGYEAFDIDF